MAIMMTTAPTSQMMLFMSSLPVLDDALPIAGFAFDQREGVANVPGIGPRSRASWTEVLTVTCVSPRMHSDLEYDWHPRDACKLAEASQRADRPYTAAGSDARPKCGAGV